MVYIPDGQMRGELIKESRYDFASKRMKTVFQNTFFSERFGRNDFQSIDFYLDKDYAFNYIKKYMSKRNDRVIYSRGLPDTFRCDINEEDVVGYLGPFDDKFLLFDTFKIYRDGKCLGTFEAFKEHYLYSKIKVPRLAG